MEKKSFINRFLVGVGGILTTKVSAYSFDYLLYPFIIHLFGLKWGFAIMLVLAFVTNFLLILLYNKTKRDIFGFEKLKELKEKSTEGKKTLFARIISMGSVVTFIFLSWYDPFLATLWFRKSTKFEHMSKRDWKILIMGTIVGNMIWAPMVFGALKIFGY